MKRRNQNADSVKLAATYLGPLSDEIVFVGGTVPALLITDPAAPDTRPTDDVDVIIPVTGRDGYYRIEAQLRAMGFGPDFSEERPVVCRWIKQGLKIDFMPSDENIFGFSNSWYELAFAEPLCFDLGDGINVRVINAPLFICTKIEARKTRDESKDIEDIVMVIDGRDELMAEIKAAPAVVRACINEWCQNSLSDNDFLDALPGYLPPDEASQSREDIILDRMKRIRLLSQS